MTPVVGATGLCWLIHASAAPSLAPLALSASLAAAGGAPLASAHSTLSPSYLHDPRLAPWCYRASWLAQGCVPLLRPFALLLAFCSSVPSGSLLRYRFESSP